MTPRFEIDPDITRAATLPASFYRSQDIYDQLVEKVLAPSWQWIGHAGELAPGELRPVDLLPSSVDEPLVLARDLGGELRCLSNVCTHRGNLLVSEAGAAKRLRCRYHGRTFGLDGRFAHMPAFEEARDFPRACEDLPRLALESLLGGSYTALGPPSSFGEWTAQLAPLLETLPVEEFVHAPQRAEVYDVGCHWALYVDNFLEGFHIPYVHPGLAALVEDGSYRTELGAWGNLQTGLAREGELAFEAAQTVGEQAGPVAAYYFWLFPSTMLNVYPWGVSVNVVEPLGLGRTRVRFEPYVWRPELVGRGAGGALEEVQREDEQVVESVQRGMRSRLYERGRFSPQRELGVHQFHRLLAAAVE